MKHYLNNYYIYFLKILYTQALHFILEITKLDNKIIMYVFY